MTQTITLPEAPEQARPQPAQRKCNLLLHVDSIKASREEVADTPTPNKTKTWQPIPHVTVLNVIERAIKQKGYRVVNEAHGLSNDSARYFGLLEIESANSKAIMSRVVGIRNAHDKRFAAGIVAGAQVLVCDNLCFSGDIAFARKHTTNILKDLNRMADSAVLKLSGYWERHAKRVELYKKAELDDSHAHDLIIKSVDAGVMSNSYIPKVLKEWREPQHEVFKTRNYWSLQNAYTEVFKGNVRVLPERTSKLHTLLDASVNHALNL